MFDIKEITLFDIVPYFVLVIFAIWLFWSFINYEYDIYEYCYHYVTLDDEEFDYCSEKDFCNKSNRLRPETSCEVDGNYFLVKELELNKRVLRKTSILKEIER